MFVECVVVAEQSRARLFIRDRAKKIFRELEDMTNPEGRLHEQEFMSDKQGRSYDSMGNNRHAMEQKTGPARQAAIRFAKDICRQLESLRNDYEKLILVAPPMFLGLLRDNLPDPLAKQVVREISKELVQKSPEEIEKYLKELPE